MEDEKLLSLEEISEKYKIVLVDTCTLIGYIDKIKKGMNLENYIFECPIIKSLEQGNCYTISGVIEEYFGKSTQKHLDKTIKGKILKAKRSNLIKNLHNLNKVIKNDYEKERYDFFKTRLSKVSSYNDLTEVDRDLLLYGCILSFNKGSSTIITNDNGINIAHSQMRKKEGRSFDQFGIFLRRGLDKFALWDN